MAAQGKEDLVRFCQHVTAEDQPAATNSVSCASSSTKIESETSTGARSVGPNTELEEDETANQSGMNKLEIGDQSVTRNPEPDDRMESDEVSSSLFCELCRKLGTFNESYCVVQKTLASNEALRDIVTKICSSSAVIVSQQRGDDDLPEAHKLHIILSLLEESKPKFLRRFGGFLSWDELNYFEPCCEGDEELSGVLARFRQSSMKVNVHVRVKNRRYKAIQEMLQQGDYFSEEEMRRRDPLLYDRLIGRHLTAEEAQSRVCEETASAFSSVLLQNLTRRQDESLRQAQLMAEDSQTAESEEDEDSEESEMEDEEAASAEEKAAMREEFMRTMQQRFLTGRDRNFDYRKVDDNPNYDDLDTLDRDLQDRYFEDDEQEDGADDDCMLMADDSCRTTEYTGELDY